MTDMTRTMGTIEALNTLFAGEGDGTGAPHALLAFAPPRGGKTDFAFAALLGALDRFGDTAAAMTVANRTTADRLGDEAVRHIGASAQVRPVTTLSAIAFRVIAAERFAAGEPAPRLLNGAEQDALLRSVLAVHLAHAHAGELCDVCVLLRDYFASDDWANAVGSPDDDADDGFADGGSARGASAPEPSTVGAADGSTSAKVFERGVSAAFANQLRDMLARMNELGASFAREDDLIEAARAQGERSGRLELQWRLAFALRREYVEAIARAYPGEYRLDASRLLVEGAAVLRRSLDGPDGVASAVARGLPRLLVVDEFQDTTLAGLRFLEALADSGVRLLLVGNPDEAVQTFRGSYPEYLFAQAREGRLHAVPIRVEPPADAGLSNAGSVAVGEPSGEGTDDDAADADGAPARKPVTYRDIVVSRVSLSIPSPEDDPTPLPDRPGKAPRLTGSLPIESLDVEAAQRGDGSFAAALYRSPREELDDVVWRIKRARLDGNAQWNDMAVIAHDNATVRTFGERLRRDGVPVRYSSVTRPLSEEPFVQGLFALIELARLRRQGLDGTAMALGQIAAFARARVATLMDGPLITVGSKTGPRHPARLDIIESAMGALESLAPIVDTVPGDISGGIPEDAAGDDATADAIATPITAMDENGGGADRDDSDVGEAGGALRSLARAWRSLAQTAASRAGSAERTVRVDDSLVDVAAAADAGSDAPAFGRRALYAMLALDDPHAPATDVIAAIGQVVGTDPQLRAFQRLWLLVDKVADGLGALVSEEPQFALALAWDATGVARAWQTAALANTPEGRAANDRLDTAMRLFQYAEGGTAGHDIVQFIAQVRSMQIEADSLAHVGPIEQAVTLTTPAGAAGRHWAYVWMPAIQQDVWPNLAERNTMFGGEDMTDVILHGRTAQGTDGVAQGAGDPRLAAVLSSEKKSLLVALTRADRLVTVSAVRNDDTTPSDFLYGYLPEWYDRAWDDYTTVGAETVADTLAGRSTHGTFTHDGNGVTMLVWPGAPTLRDAAGSPDASDAEAAAQRDPARLFHGEFAGLDADPRGLIAAARVILATTPADSDEAKDAAKALALLAAHGVESADPDDWAYPSRTDAGESAESDAAGGSERTVGTDDAVDAGRSAESGRIFDSKRSVELRTQDTVGGTAHTEASDKPPMASLSPSSVDRLWECPVCWKLENTFAGPRPGSVATGFGTLIHAVAQRGSEEGLDRPDFMTGATHDERLAAVTARLVAIYDEMRTDPSGIDDPASRYAAIRKDERAADTLANVAAYFVGSNEDDYLGSNAKYFEVGSLDEVFCEREFAARFDLDDILAAYNATPGVEPVDRHELGELMGLLVGGWPEGMRDDLIVRLTGRIDRMETRTLSDGGRRVRLIDYKTGQVIKTRQIVNDLQLVCYQLGLVFPERVLEPASSGRRAQSGFGARGAEALAAAPEIGQCALFHVEHKSAPALSREPEGLHQPALFTHGSLNADPYTPRHYLKDPAKLLDMSAFDPNVKPRGVEDIDDAKWRGFASLSGTQALWSLTMIARVFYTAAASRSERLTAHPTENHLAHCRMRTVCPACAGQIDTVFETRQA